MKTKFTVVLWELRRIEMLVEAEDKDHAEAHATAVWDQIPDMDAAFGIKEVVEIDNHEIKSIIIEGAA